MEVGDAAVGLGDVAAGGGEVEGRDAGPEKADGDLGVEVVAARGAEGGEGGVGRRDGVNAKAEKWVADVAAEAFEVDEPDAEFAAVEAFQRHLGSENGAAQDEAFGLGGGGGHERRDVVDGVLTIGVEHEGVGEVFREREAEAVEDGSAFAGVLGKLKNTQELVAEFGGEGGNGGVGAVVGAIDHDPDRRPDGEGLAHGAQEAGAGVEARDEDEVGDGGGHARSRWATCSVRVATGRAGSNGMCSPRVNSKRPGSGGSFHQGCALRAISGLELTWMS